MSSIERANLLDLDWRFLLPLPRGGRFRHLLLLGGSDGAAEQLEALGVAREVAVMPGKTQPDAVVCLRGARRRFRDIATHLTKGAVLYYEMDHLAAPGATLAAASRRSLRRLGLLSPALYLVHPRFGGARTYLPLDVEGALQWYLASLSARSTTATAVLDRGARLLALVDPRRIAAFAPRLAIVAVAQTDRDPRPSVLEPADLPEGLRQGRLRPVVLVRGDELSRLVMLPFASASRRPLAVVKLDRRPPVDLDRQDEQDVLAAIRPTLSPQMRSTVPQPLGVVRRAWVSAAVESFLPGEWLHAKWARDNLGLADLIEDLEVVAEWLAKFHLQSRVELRRWGDGGIERWVERPISDYERAFGATPPEAQLFANARRHARAAAGLWLPVVWQHWDFSSLNVLRDGPTVRVIDWQSAAPGLPLDDLIYFATRWFNRAQDRSGDATTAGYAAAADGLRQLFLEPRRDDAAVDAAWRAIDRYMQRLELDARFLPLALVHAWVRRATGRLERRTNVGSPPVNARERNRYVAYVEVLAMHADRLFHS
jgi:aminoglycoside phosphotransferase (APT) family kinase protein